MDTKTMKVSELTHSRLQALGQKGDSFDTIIATLLDGNVIAGAVRDPGSNAKRIVRRDLMKGYQAEGIAIGDFNDEDDPYKAFLLFWKEGKASAEVALFFADDRRRPIIDSGTLVRPTGHKVQVKGEDRQRMFANYFSEILLPWIEKAVAPHTLVAKRVQYLGRMTYWGVVVALQEETQEDGE